MNFTKAIEDNRQALITFVASLMALAGLNAGVVSRISPALRREVLRLLRPAEAAVRRLIVVAARGLTLKPVPPGPSRDFKQLPKIKGKPRRPSFQLSDPRPPLAEPVKRGRYAKRGPRIYNIWSHEPTVPGFYAFRAMGPDPIPAPKPQDGLANAGRLVRRLQAIAAALEDIPKQAKRLVRWRARREAISAVRLVYTSPLRKGQPPGLPEEPVLEIEHVLRRCHWMVYEAFKTDTS